MGSIINPSLYEAVLRAAVKLMEQEPPPTRMLRVNDVLYRASPREFVQVLEVSGNKYLTRSSADNAIKVRDFDVDSNRFSGHSPLPIYSNSGSSLLSVYSNGGCYFFTNQGSGLAELMHYAEKAGFRKDYKTGRVHIANMMRHRDVFRVRVTKPLMVADISLYGPNAPYARGFLQKLGSHNLLNSPTGDTSVNKMFPGVALEDEVVNQSGDYSVTRALGHAFAQFPPYCVGVIAQTARETERAGESGENICLFGSPKYAIAGIEVISVYRFFPTKNDVEEYPVQP